MAKASMIEKNTFIVLKVSFLTPRVRLSRRLIAGVTIKHYRTLERAANFERNLRS